MKRQILNAIIFAFMAGITSQFLVCVVLDILHPPKHDLRDEFRGLKYGLVLSYNVLLIFPSLSGLFFCLKKIRLTLRLNFIVWFLPRFLVQCMLAGLAVEWKLDNISFPQELLLLIPFANSMVWWWYYFKIKRFI